jgi:hypothetical protein
MESELGMANYKIIELNFRALSDDRAALLLLASRLHAARHGKLPDTPQELVPSLLDRIPIDPFADNDQPFHYRLDPAGPTVWSVGNNGTDEGGPRVVFYDYTTKRRYEFSSDVQENPADIIYGAAWRTAVSPYPPPSTAPESLDEAPPPPTN